ncbi:MAG: chorismate synthase [Chitinophagaceae bacterium]|nr:chorismate synthase [Chitinophagaceae bacterium]
MNSFGRLFRISIFGESHGESVGIVIDGCPAGLSLTEEDLLADLERRKGGKQKGTTPRQEADYPIFKSGLFNGKTTGFPITIFFENNNTRSEDYQKQRSIPRPGHADWVAHQKFGGNEDYRGGGHFSARLTTGLVAAGAIAKKLMQHLTPGPSPKERGAEDSSGFGYITNNADEWKSLKDFARQNRKNQTDAEEKLWQELRNRQVDGYKFRRQHPIAGFIPDFVCLEKKLIIEIDGGYHTQEDQKKYDQARTAWLQEHQYDLLRFTNEQVLTEMSLVVKDITTALTRPVKSIQGAESGSPLFQRGVRGEVERSDISIHAEVIEIAGEKDLEKGLQKAIDGKDSVGGLVECRVSGLPVGLGEPYFDSLESSLAHILFAIPAVRGVEFGTGFAAAKMYGSEHNDAIENMEGKTRTNHAGGIVGGISNGNELVFRIAIKPTSSTPKQQNSLNWDTGKIEDFSVKGRHDLCVALRAPVIVEAATAVTLADFLLLEQHIKRVVS